MLPREDFSESVNVEVALVVSTSTSLPMVDGTLDRAEKHDLGCFVAMRLAILPTRRLSRRPSVWRLQISETRCWKSRSMDLWQCPGWWRGALPAIHLLGRT